MWGSTRTLALKQSLSATPSLKISDKIVPVGTIHVLVGISGSGKTTWANAYQQENSHVVILSRDEERKTRFGLTEETLYEHYLQPPSLLRTLEDAVSAGLRSKMDRLVKESKSVIIDDTNLSKEYIEQYKQRYPKSTVVIKYFPIAVEEAIVRDAARTRHVGAVIITRQYARFLQVYPGGELVDNVYM